MTLQKLKRIVLYSFLGIYSIFGMEGNRVQSVTMKQVQGGITISTNFKLIENPVERAESKSYHYFWRAYMLSQTYHEVKRDTIKSISQWDKLTDPQLIEYYGSRDNAKKMKTVQHPHFNPRLAAVHNKDKEFLDFLLRNGANPYYRSLSGDTVYERLAREEALSILDKHELFACIIGLYAYYNRKTVDQALNEYLDRNAKRMFEPMPSNNKVKLSSQIPEQISALNTLEIKEGGKE